MEGGKGRVGAGEATREREREKVKWGKRKRVKAKRVEKKEEAVGRKKSLKRRKMIEEEIDCQIKKPKWRL